MTAEAKIPLSEAVLFKRESLLRQYQQAFPSAQKLTVSFVTPAGQAAWSQLWVLPRGATLAAWLLAWGDEIRDILLGSPNESEFALQDVYFGAICGRVANRIKTATFQLCGQEYILEANNGENALHGSHPGFHEKNWQLQLRKQTEKEAVLEARLVSPSGEAGYPGKLSVNLRLRLMAEQKLALTLQYEARADQPTLCNLTNHAYFNLQGHECGTLADHQLEVVADYITRNDETSCPTGDLQALAGGILDFREQKGLASVLAQSQTHPDLQGARGLDHNFVLALDYREEPVLAAKLSCKNLQLACYTNQPGLQVYTANYLNNHLGKRSASGLSVSYPSQSGICLEAQAWPDAVHHDEDGFPSIVLQPTETYRQTTKYEVDFI